MGYLKIVNGRVKDSNSHDYLNAKVIEVQDPDNSEETVNKYLVKGKVDAGGTVRHFSNASTFKTIKNFNKPCRLTIWYLATLKGMTYTDLGNAVNKKHPGYLSEAKKVSRYIGAELNLGDYLANAFAEELDATYDQITEVFIPPTVRGIGDYWLGDKGTVYQDYTDPDIVKDFESRILPTPSLMDYKDAIDRDALINHEDDEQDNEVANPCNVFNVGDSVQLRPETFKALEDMTVFDLFTIVRNAVKVAYGVELQIGDKLADIAVPRK